jgi:hypothetical protein
MISALASLARVSLSKMIAHRPLAARALQGIEIGDRSPFPKEERAERGEVVKPEAGTTVGLK